MESRVWFVTGASSGFGLAVTKVALENGDNVVATMRSPIALPDLSSRYGDRLLILKCDVTIPEEIHVAFNRTIEVFGRCDIVLNSAGCSVLCEVEGTPEEAVRAMFDVNFWGTSIVSQEAVRLFREVNPPKAGGRLLNISSGCGFVGLSGGGYYAASKFAVEGLTESLAGEMDPEWNIKISVLAPSAFKTRAHTAGTVKFPPLPPYTKPSLPSSHLRRFFDNPEAHVKGDVDLAAEQIYKFTLLPSPPLRWAIGKSSSSAAKNRIERIIGELDGYESWSDNLGSDE